MTGSGAKSDDPRKARPSARDAWHLPAHGGDPFGPAHATGEAREDILFATLEEVDIPVRALSILAPRGITLVGQLVQIGETELLRMDNLGRGSVRRIKERLGRLSLRLGMPLPDWDDAEAERRRADGGTRIRATLRESGGDDAVRFPTVEDEARAMFGSVTTSRNADILMAIHGLAGAPQGILEAGRAAGLGVPRIRAIRLEARRRFAVRGRAMPRLDAALAVLASIELAMPLDMSHAVTAAGLSTTELHPAALLALAEFTGREAPFSRERVGDHEMWGSPSSLALARLCLAALRRATSSQGYATPAAIAAQLGRSEDEVRQILSKLPEAVWLDADMIWLIWARPARNRIAGYARKIFTVCDAISVADTCRCLARVPRIGDLPPPDVVAAILSHHGLAVRDGDLLRRARATAPIRLGTVEQALWQTFRSAGSPLPRARLEASCVGRHGINPISFAIYVKTSAIVMDVAPDLYALAGYSPDPA